MREPVITYERDYDYGYEIRVLNGVPLTFRKLYPSEYPDAA